MLIGEVAAKTGVHIETIRYYERVGLLADPPRTRGRHRIYDEHYLQRLTFIRRCRELGFSFSNGIIFPASYDNITFPRRLSLAPMLIACQ